MTTPVAPDLSTSTVASLSTLLENAASFEEHWSEKDLASIIEHQLSSPVEFEMGDLTTGQFDRLTAIAGSRHLLLHSFGELLLHENPPLGLLVRTKDFAKRLQAHPESPLPKEIFDVLYFAAIAVALIRHNRMITKLDRVALHKAFTCEASRKWVPQQVRQLFRTADGML